MAWMVVVTVVFDSYEIQTPDELCRSMSHVDKSRCTHIDYTRQTLTSTKSAFNLVKPNSMIDRRPYITPIPRPNDKVILRWTKFYGRDWNVPDGRSIFENLKCPRVDCFISDNKNMLMRSDLIVIHVRDLHSRTDVPRMRTPAQLWLFLSLESPFHQFSNTSVIKSLNEFNGLFNWTSTYSSESDFPIPYGSNERLLSTNIGQSVQRNYAFGKTRQVVWFVTNCKSKNSREAYAHELSKFIQVDIFGLCGPHECKDDTMCNNMIKSKYKFYLAFENSNCNEYITEKLWINALSNDAIPIVMGAPRQHYERLAPQLSFIHVDDFSSPRKLAKYLKKLDKNDDLYNNYFQWRKYETVHWYVKNEPLKSAVWCSLCDALHSPSGRPNKTHQRLDRWWSIEQQCPGNLFHNKSLTKHS